MDILHQDSGQEMTDEECEQFLEETFVLPDLIVFVVTFRATNKNVDLVRRGRQTSYKRLFLSIVVINIKRFCE